VASTTPALEDLHRLRDLWTTHGTRATLAVCLVLAAAIGWRIYQHRTEGQERKASEKLLTARTPQELEALIAAYPSTDAEPLALLRLAKLQYNMGNYDVAFTKYSQFLAKHPAHPMAKAADMGKIICTEAKGDWPAAQNAYATFVQQNPKHYLLPQALLGKARCLWLMGRLDEARVAFEDFVATYPEKRWTSVAEEALATIKKELTRKTGPSAVPATDAPSPAVSSAIPTPAVTNVPTAVAKP
jgi:predicted negative regulator of RcsB-dependent stress response